MSHSPIPWELSDCDPYRIQSACDGDLIVTTRFSTEKTPKQAAFEVGFVSGASFIKDNPDL